MGEAQPPGQQSDHQRQGPSHDGSKDEIPAESHESSNVSTNHPNYCEVTLFLYVCRHYSFDAIAVMAGSKSGDLEYRHNEGGWNKVKPTAEEVCLPGLIHDASTLYMGPESDPHAAIDDNYTPYGCKNVHVTGAAIFPSAGEFLCIMRRARDRQLF